MSTPAQSEYIRDLAVQKTKEFKEVKELIIANEIVKEGSEIVGNAINIAEITNALTDLQASKLIDVLNKTKAPVRGSKYSDKRVEKISNLVEDIINDIEDWDFNGL